jgi:hypothetical protein
MTSLQAMLKKASGLVDTKDVSAWENDFLKSVLKASWQGENTRALSGKQVECLERIYNKHFA